MERLWSLAVATGGNQSQIASRRWAPEQAKTVAMRCHRLPENLDGKEGVSGSSPEEGFVPLASQDLLSGLFHRGRYLLTSASSRGRNWATMARFFLRS
jgi:hypothetical protein